MVSSLLIGVQTFSLPISQLLKARLAVGDEHPFMNDCVECRVVQQDRRGPKVRRNTRRHGFASVADDATLVIDVGSSRSGSGVGAIIRVVDRDGFIGFGGRKEIGSAAWREGGCKYV